ncbi:MAG: LEA type 2 family protein [Candidatus Woesearchaeota archaeon]
MKRPQKILLISACSAILLIMIYLGAYAHSISKIEVAGANFEDFEDINLDGFTLNWNIELYNGGVVPVRMEGITYEIALENSSRIIGTGSVDGNRIPPGRSVRFPVSSRIDWVPSQRLILKLFQEGDTYAVVKGTVHVADLGLAGFNVHFEEKVDIEQYLKQFATAKAEEFLGSLADI